MGSRPNTWETLPTFEMWPEKTFFGLDKKSAHCFTLPNVMTKSIVQHFSLKEGKLQAPITLIINNQSFPATIRLGRQDRSKPRKLSVDALPKRDFIQFQWPKQEITISAIRVALQDAFKLVIAGKKNTNQSAIFVHVRGDQFLVIPNRQE